MKIWFLRKKIPRSTLGSAFCSAERLNVLMCILPVFPTHMRTQFALTTLHFDAKGPFKRSSHSLTRSIRIYYWPSARSRWLDIGRVLFLRFNGPRPIFSHLDRTSLVNKRFIVWHKEHWKKMIFVLVYFRALKRNPVKCLSDSACPYILIG